MLTELDSVISPAPADEEKRISKTATEGNRGGLISCDGINSGTDGVTYAVLSKWVSQGGKLVIVSISPLKATTVYEVKISTMAQVYFVQSSTQPI